jgi:signal transduction histidine kinase
MASGIAHEINNPLAIISGRASLLKMALKGMNNPQINETEAHLKVIDETITRIAEIIKGLKVFSRESSKDDMVLTSLNKILGDTHQLCKHRLIHKQIELHLVGDVDLNIHCRSVQLSQVFMNLISNSIDALEELPTKWIRIEVKKIDRMACIYFSDSGLGISDEIAEKILQPFFSTKEVGKGTGLGLSISKGILESHGGSLTYEAKSKNTTFKISLPLDE